MQVFHQLAEVASRGESAAVAIVGDVHLGHVELLQNMLEEARRSGTTAAVLTFFPHPVGVLNPTKKLERLTTASEKLRLFEALAGGAVLDGIRRKSVAALSPAEFFNATWSRD